MDRFRTDNTEGYSQHDLDLLNAAFDREMESSDTYAMDELTRAAFEDYIAEQVQQTYDLHTERRAE